MIFLHCLLTFSEMLADGVLLLDALAVDVTQALAVLPPDVAGLLILGYSELSKREERQVRRSREKERKRGETGWEK